MCGDGVGGGRAKSQDSQSCLCLKVRGWLRAGVRCRWEISSSNRTRTRILYFRILGFFVLTSSGTLPAAVGACECSSPRHPSSSRRPGERKRRNNVGVGPTRAPEHCQRNDHYHVQTRVPRLPRSHLEETPVASHLMSPHTADRRTLAPDHR